MSTTFYVFDNLHIKAEGMTKEQIINAIAEATGSTPQNIDEGFITTIVETNNNHSLHLWKGTKAQYDALQTHDADTFYIISDDTTIQDLQSDYENLAEAIEAINNNDTGWIDITRTKLSSESGTIGRYRVKNGIAYFDFAYKPSDYYSGDADHFDLPIKLDIGLTDGNKVFVITGSAVNLSASFVRAYAFYSAGETRITIDAPSTSTQIIGSFCYPVATNN